MRKREPMSYVPPGVIRKYGLAAPRGATTRTTTSRAILSASLTIEPLDTLIVSFSDMPVGESSFDVVSQFDRQEMVNAIDQATKEIHTRYDLKDSGSTIELEATMVKLHSATEMTLDAVRDVLLQRAVKRQLSPKVFDYGKVEEAAKGTVRQTATLRQGLSQDLAREITKLIRDRLPKLKTQIQGDAVRVTGKSKDELQAAIQLLRKSEVDRNWPVALQFVNYR